MNHDAMNAHLRLLESGLPRHEHVRTVGRLPQGRRMPDELKERVRNLLRVHNPSEVARLTGVHPKTVARMRNPKRGTT